MKETRQQFISRIIDSKAGEWIRGDYCLTPQEIKYIYNQIINKV